MGVDYRPIVRQALHPFGDRSHLDLRAETLRLFDDASGCYAVADLIWQDGERLLQPLVLVRVRGDKVVVEINTTDADLDRLLLEAGVPYSNLVLDEEEPAPQS